jgi:tetraacyldisaccharide 4'-kinase
MEMLLKIAFFPLSLLYGLVIWIRNALFDLKILKSKEFKIPVISVGNITVGGTGKTPHTEYLIKLLKPDFKIAFLSRGYKRKTSNFRIATENSNYEEIGDEPYQIKKKFPEILVAVDANRVNGIKKIVRQIYKFKIIAEGISCW